MSRRALYRRACWRLFCRYQRGTLSRLQFRRLFRAISQEFFDDRHPESDICLN